MVAASAVLYCELEFRIEVFGGTLDFSRFGEFAGRAIGRLVWVLSGGEERIFANEVEDLLAFVDDASSGNFHSVRVRLVEAGGEAGEVEIVMLDGEGKCEVVGVFSRAAVGIVLKKKREVGPLVGLGEIMMRELDELVAG